MGFLLHVTDIKCEKWRTLEDSNLWPLPSEGSLAPIVRPMFTVSTCFRSRSSGFKVVQTVTRNSYPNYVSFHIILFPRPSMPMLGSLAHDARIPSELSQARSQRTPLRPKCWHHPAKPR